MNQQNEPNQNRRERTARQTGFASARDLGLIASCTIAILWFGSLREFCFPDRSFHPVLFVATFGVLYFLLAGFAGGGRNATVRNLNRRAAAYFLATNLIILFLWYFPWTPRQTFFHDLARVRSGMTAAEVDALLARYQPVKSSEFNGRTGPSARPLEAPFPDGLVYIRSDKAGDYNTYKDYGIVSFEGGKVTGVQECAD
ncbi:MAG: hypothetical protein V4671_00350 [Armatimonadota bacterium]